VDNILSLYDHVSFLTSKNTPFIAKPEAFNGIAGRAHALPCKTVTFPYSKFLPQQVVVIPHNSLGNDVMSSISAQ
jgi:hypothetical protein